MHPLAADPLVPALEEFEAALARPAAGDEPNWRKALHAALKNLDAALLGHDRLASAPDGLLATLNRPIHANQPTLDHDQFRLRALRQDLRERIQALTQLAAASPSASVPLASLREESRHLAASLRRYLEKEMLLVFNTANTEIGVLD
jgi:hypothetical protein